MQVILSDYNCEGQAKAIFEQLALDGDWLELVPMQLKLFRDISLNKNASDDQVWQRCQGEKYILLTGNRSTSDGQASLEFKIRELITPSCLPILTIGNLKRVIPDITRYVSRKVRQKEKKK